MPKVAKSEHSYIRIGSNVYVFSDGDRQVTEAEAQELEESAYDVQIEDQKTTRKDKS